MVKTIGFQPIFRGSIPRVDIFLFLILCKQFLINNLYLITNNINKLSNLQIKLNKKQFFISKHLKLALNVASNLAECFSSEGLFFLKDFHFLNETQKRLTIFELIHLKLNFIDKIVMPVENLNN